MNDLFGFVLDLAKDACGRRRSRRGRDRGPCVSRTARIKFAGCRGACIEVRGCEVPADLFSVRMGVLQQ